MKKIVFCLLAMLAVALQARAELEADALRFRTNIRTFLQEEGFSPYIDSDDESLCFKKEGVLYWLDFMGSKPVYIQFHRSGNGTEDCDLGRLLEIINDINREYRCVKVTLSSTGKSVNYNVEVYCNSPEDFRYAFYKYIKVLDSAKKEVLAKYAEGGSSASSSGPAVKYNSASVRNEDAEGNPITDYGVTIYSYRTKYLKPRINLTVKKSGNYDIYVKMYGPNGLTTGSSSPDGYSYKVSKYLSEGTSDVTLTGWGSDTAGHWKAGDYRFEFYLNGKLLGTKYFTVK